MDARREPFLVVAVAAGFVAYSALALASGRQLLRRPRLGIRRAVSERAVFLDLDGVLNRVRGGKQVALEADLVDRLRRIVESQSDDVSIVLSTYWRPFAGYVAYVLQRHGIDARRVVGVTPGRGPVLPIQTDLRGRPSVFAALMSPDDVAFDDVSVYPNRAAEIRAFLWAHPHVRKFVILDDRHDAADAELLDRFIRTETDVGLTEDHVREAIALLA